MPCGQDGHKWLGSPQVEQNLPITNFLFFALLTRFPSFTSSFLNIFPLDGAESEAPLMVYILGISRRRASVSRFIIFVRRASRLSSSSEAERFFDNLPRETSARASAVCFSSCAIPSASHCSRPRGAGSVASSSVGMMIPSDLRLERGIIPRDTLL